MNNLRELGHKSRAAMLAFMVAGGALVGGAVFFAGTQVQASGQCVEYVYSRGGVANCIITIQEIINASGVTSSLQADGAYGPQTERAVAAFQQHHGITPDGIVGKKTWAKLCAVTQAAATAPKANAGCASAATSTTMAAPAPAAATTSSSLTKIAWGSATNGAYAADVEIYACKLPGKKSGQFQVRSKTIVVSSIGNPKISTFLDIRSNDAAMTVTASANSDKTRTFPGKPGASQQLTTTSSSRGKPGYAVATDLVRVQADVLGASGSGAATAASTITNYGSVLSRPLTVSQLADC